MSFSLTDNGTHPIALIKNGKKAKYIYLITDDHPLIVDESSSSSSSDSDDEEVSVLDEKNLDEATIAAAVKLMKSGGSLREAFKRLEVSGGGKRKKRSRARAKAVVPPVLFKSYTLKPGEEIETVPSAKPERLFLAGQTGGGKSYLTAQYAKRWKKIFPEGTIYAFLRQEDENYNDFKKREIIMDWNYEDLEDESHTESNKNYLQKLVDVEITLDELHNSLLIVDDCDNLQDKKLSTAIHKLLNDAVHNGRKRSIWVVYISHMIFNYAKTRDMLTASNKVFMFPGGVDDTQIEAYLQKFGGYKKKPAEELLRGFTSTWIMLARQRPRYFLHRKGLFIA